LRLCKWLDLISTVLQKPSPHFAQAYVVLQDMMTQKTVELPLAVGIGSKDRYIALACTFGGVAIAPLSNSLAHYAARCLRRLSKIWAPFSSRSRPGKKHT
jgi:hypothetical protein